MQKLERPYTCLLFVVNESLFSEVNTPHSWSFRTHSMQATCLQNITMSCKRRRVCMHALQTMYGGQLGSTHRTAGAIILIQMPQGAYPDTMMTQSTWSKQKLPFHPSRLPLYSRVAVRPQQLFPSYVRGVVQHILRHAEAAVPHVQHAWRRRGTNEYRTDEEGHLGLCGALCVEDLFHRSDQSVFCCCSTALCMCPFMFWPPKLAG